MTPLRTRSGLVLPFLRISSRIAEPLRMRAKRDLVQIPVARLLVERIRALVEARILEELAQRFALRAAALHVGDEAVLEDHFPSREEPAVALRARQSCR